MIKQADKPGDIPDVPHIAVIVFDSTEVHIPGDERSRTHPGHGYPAHTVTTTSTSYYYATDIAEVEAFVATLERPQPYGVKKPYQVIHVDRKIAATVAIRFS